MSTYIRAMDGDDFMLLLILLVLIIILVARTSFLEKTRGSYRLGNIVGFWYTDGHEDVRVYEDFRAMSHGHDGTFGAFLKDYRPTERVDDPNVLTDEPYWWDRPDTYRKIYPQFNKSLRAAIKEYKGWEFSDVIGPDTCVIHMRLGDFLEVSDRTMNVDEIVRATDKLPRDPAVFEILNGGKFHQHDNDSSSVDVQKQSDKIIDDLCSKIKEKYPNTQVNKIESENADKDFYRMVHAPMLITGLGSFATMATAANENFRLSPGFTLRAGGRDNATEETLYEQWLTYV
jgi:hypothetical protein